MTIRVPTHFPARVNMRVPNMSFEGSLGMQKGSPFLVEFQDVGVPLATISTTAIMSVQTMAANGAAFAASTFVGGVLPMAVPGRGRYGVCLQFVASGANTGVLEVVGRDYLGQRLVKRVTLAGAVAVTASTGATDTAFWIIESVTVVSGSGAVNISIGTQNKYGLPFAATAISGSLIDSVTASAHTLVTRITTTQSNSTADPRGLITFSSAANGARTFAAYLMHDYTNLHGNAQNAS